MATHDEAQEYLDLSREYLATALVAHGQSLRSPARFNMIHALELAIKATLASRMGEVPRTHNVGGEFGRLFRAHVGGDVTRRVNRILQDYDAVRYPDEQPATPRSLDEDIEFVRAFVENVAPSLVEARP